MVNTSNGSPSPSVLICDAQHLLAESLGESLARREQVVVLDSHPSTAVAALKATSELRPDVALVDFWLDGMAGPALIQALAAHAPGTKVINLSWFHGPDTIHQAIGVGAVGFLPKSESVDRVHRAVLRGHAGERPVFAEELEQLAQTLERRAAFVTEQDQRLATLTLRELEVLRLLALGHDRTGAARKLKISVNTARNHVQNMLAKTDTPSQARLVALARARGFV